MIKNKTVLAFGFFLLFVASPALASLTVTTNNQYGSEPFTPAWTPASDSLIAGLDPIVALGNFNVEGAANVDSLTAGGSLTISSVNNNYVVCGNGSGAGSEIVYTLPASGNGYNITNITVYGGWANNGRDAQAYTVSYATTANPTNFTALTSVNYDPSASVPGGAASATCVSITDSAGGVVVSNVVALMFDFTTPASENGYCGYAAITVEGTAASGSTSYPVVSMANQYGFEPFTPTWTPASDSLIAGLDPSTALGNFNVEGSANVDSLTAGGSLTISSVNNNYVVCGNGSGAGSKIVYTLPVSANGYNITNITVYGGWANNGRDAQAYTVSYSTVANPGVFTALTEVNCFPSVPSGPASATCVTIVDSTGVLASNVAALEFDFTTPSSENGYCGYAAITVEGTAASGGYLIVTTNNQYGSEPFTPTWTPASDSLIAGLDPSTALGNFNVEGSANVDSLTAGGSLTISSVNNNYVVCGNGSGAGSNIVYTLPASANGYNITNITVYGGWANNGRDAQAYTVRYSTTANPAVFTALTEVNYDPSASVPGGVASATCVTITDSAGVLASNVLALEFDFTTPPSENGYCGYAVITVGGTAVSGGAGYPVVTENYQQGALPFTPTWTPTSHSLIAGLNPTTADGNFSVEGSGANVDSLTAGGSLTISQVPADGGATCSSDYVTCGNAGGAGSNIVYTLPTSANGYNITNITVYGGWTDGGRDQQAYTVWYATAANPSVFTALTEINYLPSDPSGLASATCVTIVNSVGGVLVSNVVALQFDFTNPAGENGYCGYGAITVQGIAPPVAAVMTAYRTAGTTLKVALSDIATNWSDAQGFPVELTGVNLLTTNNQTLYLLNVTTNSGSFVISSNSFVGYTNGPNLADQFSYSIADGQGGTNIGLVNIVILTNLTGQATSLINPGGSSVTVNFSGWPGYSYSVQRSTNLVTGSGWVTIWTTNAPSGGLFNYTDSFSDLGGTPSTAYYRLSLQP